MCEREGWEISEVLTDNDIGASRFSGKDRPAWRRLHDTLGAGDVLVTWVASRAQRDLGTDYVEASVVEVTDTELVEDTIVDGPTGAETWLWILALGAVITTIGYLYIIGATGHIA